MTQEELASAVHVARNTVSAWEHGHRVPDLETVRQLSQVLQYDFLKGESELPAPEEPSAGAAQPEGAKKRPRWLIPAICAAVAVLAVCLTFLLLPRETPAAEVTVRALESPVRMFQDTNVFEGDGRGWMFTFEIRNESDVPFTPEEAIINFYEGERIDSKLQMTYEDMRPWMDHDQLNKGDSPLQLLFGTNHTNVDRAECVLSGRDANGHELTFRGTVELSQEMQE